MNKYDLVLFDLDGTLVDSAHGLYIAVNQTLTQMKLTNVSYQQVCSWIGNGVVTLMERALTFLDVNHLKMSDVMPIFNKFYLVTALEAKCYENAILTLQTLKAHNVKLAVITNKAAQFTLPLLDALKLRSYFDWVVCGDSLASKKPNAEPLNWVCKQSGLSIPQTLMVGDSENDLIPAQTLKMDAVLMTYGYHQGKDLSLYQPKAQIDDLKALIPMILA